MRIIRFCFIIAVISVCAAAIGDDININELKNHVREQKKCGDNLTWWVDEEESTLTINGTGEMYNFSDDSEQPWSAYVRKVLKVVILDGVTSVGDHAFEFLRVATTIILPSSITKIGSTSFSNCPKLADINIPPGVVSIGSHAFYISSLLKSFTIPNCTVSIGEYAFSGTSITEIRLPSTLVSLGRYAFVNCYSLESITVDTNCTRYRSVDGVLFDNQRNALIAYPINKSSTSFTVPEGTLIIGEMSFKSSSVASVFLPSSLTTIEREAFASCNKLTHITIPAGVTTVTNFAFDVCKSLLSIDVEPGNKKYSSIDGVLFDAAQVWILRYPAGKTESHYTLPSTVRYVQQQCFHYCQNLKTILFPESFEGSLLGGFHYCTGLETLFYQGSTPIGSELKNMCKDCNALKTICVSPDYPSSTFWNVAVNNTADICTSFRKKFNHCYAGTFEGGEYGEVLRKNASDWEKRSNHCYEHLCDNETGGQSLKRDNATFWENQSDHCFEYKCNNRTGPLMWKRDNATKWENQTNHCFEFLCLNLTGPEAWKRDNATEWENQTNECFEFQCDNETGPQYWKRNNATQWEQKTNECFEFQCENESGLIGWSKCSSTDNVHLICMDGKCLDEEPNEKWKVEIDVDGMKAVEVNISDLIEKIEALTGLTDDEITLGIVIDDNGNMIRIIVLVDREEFATIISDAVNSLDREGCSYGVLCTKSRVRISGNQELSPAFQPLVNVICLVVAMILTASTSIDADHQL